MTNLRQINGKATAFEQWTNDALSAAAPTLPRGVERPNLVGRPASMVADFDAVLGPFRPAPKPRNRIRPTWGGVVAAVFIGMAIGYLAGLIQGVML